MTKYEIWNDLRKQVKIARSERDKQKEVITRCDWNTVDKSCIKIYQTQTLGVPSNDSLDNTFSIRYCEDFTGKHCENTSCPMNCANREYIETEIVLQGLKRARNKAFWDMFMRSK